MPDTSDPSGTGATATSPRAVPSEETRGAAAATGMSAALWASVQPDEVAVSSPSGDRTFAELNGNANRLVRALRRRGVQPGDSVVLVCRNRPELVEAVQACLRGGYRWTPINWHLTAGEAAHIVNDCGASALIGDADLAPLLSELATRCPTVGARLAVGDALDAHEDYHQVLATESGEDIEDAVAGIRMLYTSGTTGHPKGVVRPPNYSTGLAAITDAPRYRAGTGQRNLCTGPLHHGGPMSFSLLAPLASGVGTALMARWDAEEALRLIEQQRITHTHMVPTMFHRLLMLPEERHSVADVSSLTYVLHGAAPCPVAVKRAMLDWFGPVLWEYYAATEGAGASIGPQEWLDHPGSVGRPPDPEHVRIVDDHGVSCPPSVPGEIQMARVEGADFEYLNDPAKTEEARRGRYFTVGDVGFVDGDGYLYVTDRSDDLILRGGVNVYPAEVEAALLAHPGVRDAAVVGVPDEEWGEQVVAVVEPSHHPDAGPDAGHPDPGNADPGNADPGNADADDLVADLGAHCESTLAGFKCPSRIELTDALPRGDNGKLYRRRVRDGLRATAGTRIRDW